MTPRPVSFSPRAAKKLVENSRYIDQMHRSEAGGGSSAVDYGGAMVLFVTTALPRMSGATPGVGAGKIQKYVSGSYSDASTTIYPIVNPTTNLVAAGSYVTCVPAYGMWTMVNVNSCGNLS